MGMATRKGRANSNDFLSISLSALVVFLDLVISNYAYRPSGRSFIPLGAKVYVICPLIQSVLLAVIVIISVRSLTHFSRLRRSSFSNAERVYC